MLPVFAKGKNGELCLKPILQLVFEQLYQVGFQEFCFIVGRGKRAIEDHFTPDFNYVTILDSKGKDGPPEDLEKFYEMIEGSSVYWVTLQSLGYSRVFSIVIQPTCLLNPSFVLAASMGKLAESFQVLITSYPFCLE